MMLIAAFLLAQAPVEDAAHRNDRLRTEALNRAADDRGRGRARPSDRDMAAWRDAQAEYRRAQDDYARELAGWRRQMAECRSGDHEACRPR